MGTCTRQQDSKLLELARLTLGIRCTYRPPISSHIPPPPHIHPHSYKVHSYTMHTNIPRPSPPHPLMQSYSSEVFSILPLDLDLVLKLCFFKKPSDIILSDNIDFKLKSLHFLSITLRKPAFLTLCFYLLYTVQGTAINMSRISKAHKLLWRLRCFLFSADILCSSSVKLQEFALHLSKRCAAGAILRPRESCKSRAKGESRPHLFQPLTFSERETKAQRGSMRVQSHTAG